MRPDKLTAYTRRIMLASLVSLALLTACSTARVTDPNARNYVPSPGSQVTVKQRIEVPGGQTRIFLQRGEIVNRLSQVDLYKPNCNFEVNTLQESPRYIEPGVYTVTRTTRQEKEVTLQHTNHIKLAALGFGVMARGGDGGPMLFEEVKMRLQSSQPSDIRELACRGVMTDPVLVEAPTLAEIREALGSYASISVPEE